MLKQSSYKEYFLCTGMIFIEDLSKYDIRTGHSELKNYISAFIEGVGIMIRKRSHHKRTMIILLVIAYILTHCYRSGGWIILLLKQPPLPRVFSKFSQYFLILLSSFPPSKSTITSSLGTENIKKNSYVHKIINFNSKFLEARQFQV